MSMDWIRRNWPDLLIGVALLAVIAGIVATLLTGGSFFPLASGSDRGTSTQPPPVTSARPSVTTAPTGQGAGPGGTQETPSAAAQPDVTPVLPAGGAAETPAGQAAPPAVEPAAEEPAAPEVEAVTPVSPTSAAPPPAAQARPAATQAASAAPAAPAGQAGAGAQPEGAYRVGVGSFRSSENAERQAEVFRQAGYPVFVARQDDLSVVLVGPYDTESEARRALDRIATGGFGIEPLLYRYQPDEPAAAAPASAAPQQAAPAPTATEARPAGTEAAGATGGRYLQVGAYGSLQSAGPQRERLEALGFTVTARQEGNLVKLLVGPFDAAALSAAQARLEQQGIENFPR